VAGSGGTSAWSRALWKAGLAGARPVLLGDASHLGHRLPGKPTLDALTGIARHCQALPGTARHCQACSHNSQLSLILGSASSYRTPAAALETTAPIGWRRPGPHAPRSPRPTTHQPTTRPPVARALGDHHLQLARAGAVIVPLPHHALPPVRPNLQQQQRRQQQWRAEASRLLHASRRHWQRS
jgi:hypothetical protein